jgi:O-methyltransferase involved in polyketide biosynthesis
MEWQTVPKAARVHNYLLRGKDNYETDRELGDLITTEFPTAFESAYACRSFGRRATAYAAAHGIRQFLDIGPGFDPRTHQQARQYGRDTRIVYVDNDPLVVVHGRALHSHTIDNPAPIGWVHADIRDPAGIIGHEIVSLTLDFTEPIALSLVSVTEYLPEADQPGRVVAALVDALAPGSYLVLCQSASTPEGPMEAVAARYAGADIAYAPRTYEQITEFFTGLTILDPGIVTPHRWHPIDALENWPDHHINAYGAVAVIPS